MTSYTGAPRQGARLGYGAAALAAGAVITLGKAALVAAGALSWWPGGESATGAAILSLIGASGLAAAMRLRVAPVGAGQAGAVAGLLSLLLDFFGGHVLARSIAGVMMVAGSVIALSAVDLAVGNIAVGGRWQVWAGLAVNVLFALAFLPMGLVVPVWAMFLLYAIWLIFILGMLKLRDSLPWLLLASPAAALLIVGSLVFLGGSLLNWAP